jgi:hypothetical protein
MEKALNDVCIGNLRYRSLIAIQIANMKALMYGIHVQTNFDMHVYLFEQVNLIRTLLYLVPELLIFENPDRSKHFD